MEPTTTPGLSRILKSLFFFRLSKFIKSHGVCCSMDFLRSRMPLAFGLFGVIGLACYCLFHLLTWYAKMRRQCEMSSKMKGPPVLPIVGNAHLLVGTSEQILNTMVKLDGLYPSPFRVWLGPTLFFIISDPEQIKTICLHSTTQGKGEFFKNLGEAFVGTGILTAPVAKWRAHRKLIQPTFNKQILNFYLEIFVDQSKILADKIERNLDGPEFEILTLLSSCTLDMICESTMGVRMGTQLNGNCEYADAVLQVLGSFTERLFNFWLHPDFIFYRTKLGKDQLKNLKYLHDFADNVIKIKRAELLKHNDSQPTATDDKDGSFDSTTGRKACLDHLMQLTDATAKLSDEELREEVDTLILTGSDSTAMTLSYIMLMLATHPDVQDKVYQELFEIYGDADVDERNIEPEDLSRMVYLERVIKETMRLFPAIPMIVREITEDLNIGDHTFPKGSYTAIGIFCLQRNEKYWPNPLKFDPDRFSPEENAKRHPYSFMAFGGGPRNCIGTNYSLMSIKAVMATVLRRYVLKKDHFVPIKDIRLGIKIGLKPVKPITVRIERRPKN